MGAGKFVIGLLGGYVLWKIVTGNCKNCGNRLEPDLNYCRFCGAPKKMTEINILKAQYLSTKT